MVLSPMLYNIYMFKLPLPLRGINIASSSDDITVTTSHPHVENLLDVVTLSSILHDWLESRKLKLSAEKSSATVFTTWSKESKFELTLTVNNSPIPVKSKVLGVIFDSMVNFAEHLRSAKEKPQKRNNLLKKFAGSDWGCTKKTL